MVSNGDRPNLEPEDSEVVIRIVPADAATEAQLLAEIDELVEEGLLTIVKRTTWPNA